MPLAKRNLKGSFARKTEIVDLFYTLEENRNKLIYGHAMVSEIRQTLEAFETLKKILQELLGDAFEDPND